MTSDVGRRVVVPPERLQRWLDGFAERHGAPVTDAEPDGVRLIAPDGAWAQCRVPFPPLLPSAEPYAGLVAHALRERLVGALLVRRGGHAAGVFDGLRLVASKTGSRYVQGRTAAGGTSQHRYARRRDNQARAASSAAADTAVAVLLPHAAQLEALVTGGDRQALRDVLADPRLAAIDALPREPAIEVAEPRLAVLAGSPAQFTAVRILVSDPARAGGR